MLLLLCEDKSQSQKSYWEATTIVQTKDNGGLNQSGSRDGAKCSAYTLKVKPRFAEGFDVGMREQSRMTIKFLASAIEKMKLPFMRWEYQFHKIRSLGLPIRHVEVQVSLSEKFISYMHINDI